jgi:hypothetical protein
MSGEDDQTTELPPPHRYRLSWRWRNSELTGSGPWMRDPDVVEAWRESMSRRYDADIEHWVEVRSGDE